MMSIRKGNTPKSKTADLAWLDTPPDFGYYLEMIDEGDVRQFVEVSRAEFIALKHCLAEVRSHQMPV